MKKVLSKKDLLKVVLNLKKENKKIVMTNGCFDILHRGHVEYLEKSKALGDVLIVACNSDSSVKKIKGDKRPINSQDDRAYVLSGLSAVDYIVIFEEITPVDILDELKPDIYTKGADYTLETLPEAKVVIKNGGKVEFIKLVDGISTTKIIDKMK